MATPVAARYMIPAIFAQSAPVINLFLGTSSQDSSITPPLTPELLAIQTPWRREIPKWGESFNRGWNSNTTLRRRNLFQRPGPIGAPGWFQNFTALKEDNRVVGIAALNVEGFAAHMATEVYETREEEKKVRSNQEYEGLEVVKLESRSGPHHALITQATPEYSSLSVPLPPVDVTNKPLAYTTSGSSSLNGDFSKSTTRQTRQFELGLYESSTYRYSNSETERGISLAEMVVEIEIAIAEGYVDTVVLYLHRLSNAVRQQLMVEMQPSISAEIARAERDLARLDELFMMEEQVGLRVAPVTSGHFYCTG